jgi:MoaA/NifB/PqqE/SkfB family radical SAM enzyme
MKTSDAASDADVGLDFSMVLNGSLRIFFSSALKAALTDPRQANFFVKTLMRQRKAAKVREKLAKEGVLVPPILVFSVTSLCNLNCKGCYHRTLRGSKGQELSDEKLRGVIAEAKELGISFVVFGGGEPLMRKEAMLITGENPEIIFLMFTNGLLIDSDILGKMKEQRNIIPLVSLEGYSLDTDGRRGVGVFKKLETVLKDLQSAGIFWGASLTLTRDNFDTATDKGYVKYLIDQGCKLFFMVEYTPVKEGTEGWVLTGEQRTRLRGIRDSLRSKFQAVFVTLPGDEEEIGGCLSAGKGFIHVSAEGDVEPCPFIPYSDVNLNNSSLKDALQSRFLREIRLHNKELHETNGGCALWAKKEWVKATADRFKENESFTGN